MLGGGEGLEQSNTMKAGSERAGTECKVVSECIPCHPTHQHPERNTGDGSCEGQCRSLPAHRRGNLMVHEPENLQEPDFPSPAGERSTASR